MAGIPAMGVRPSGAAVAIDASGIQAALLDDAAIARVDDWSRVDVPAPEHWRSLDEVLAEAPAGAPIVLVIHGGVASLKQLRAAKRLGRRGRRIVLWWPAEGAFDVLEGSDRLRDAVQRIAIRLYGELAPPLALCVLFVRRGLRELRRTRLRPRALASLGKRVAKKLLGNGAIAEDLIAVRRLVLERGLESVRALLAETFARAKAADLPPPGADGVRFPDRGVYVRLDWWNAITSGGSYGHTCYVAAELAKRSEGMSCLMAHPFPLLDELGVPQQRIEAPYASWGEADLAGASEACLPTLTAALRRLRPGFVYERLVVGNFAVARACQDLGIPYILEFNGSETSMMRSFGGRGYLLEGLYLAAEKAAFAQAALVTVVSHPIRKSLIEQGVPASKVVVIPNGVDPERYAPASAEVRSEIRAKIGFDADDFVIGFTGTFGGWHGIDDLAEILPRVCAREPRARFLLIGDGTFRHLVDEAVARHGLEARVRFTGRVPQQEGARLLAACDAFVSPHNSHMVDSRFFGSPTKVFEYMAVGSAIVASDLEQIGEVLRPALRPADVGADEVRVRDRRAVLCNPGDIDGFVTALVGLAKHREVASALGANARRAALADFTWERHVDRLARAFGGVGGNASWEPRPRDGEPEPVRPPEPVRVPAVSREPAPAARARIAEVEDGFVARRTDEAIAVRALREAARAGERVLEIGAGPWTDLVHVVAPGASLVRVDFSEESRAHARRSVAAEGLEVASVSCAPGSSMIPLEDGSFDFVYAIGGVPEGFSTSRLADEMWRLVRPGGRVLLRSNAQRSVHYWLDLFWRLGVRSALVDQVSMAEIAARDASRRAGGRVPRPRIQTRSRLRRILTRFEEVEIHSDAGSEEDRLRIRQRTILPRVPMLGWNLVVTARKPCAD